MQQKKIAVILGDGQMAAQCAKLVVEHDGMQLAHVIHHDAGHQWASQIEKLSANTQVPHLAVGNVNDPPVLELLRGIQPDIVFSVNNWDVIRSELLAIPRDGIINFHSGPLPDYRGVNTPSWAIINGEDSFGVTWHFVTEAIDAGDIVATRHFELRPDETAISLIFACIRTGIELFSPLLDDYVTDSLSRAPQGEGGRYFSTKQTPGEGLLDFDKPYAELSALVRGLSFRPFENTFTFAKVRAGQATLLVTEIERLSEQGGGSGPPGQIRAIDERGIEVVAGDGSVKLSGLLDTDLNDMTGEDAAARHSLSVGQILNQGGD